MGKGTEVSHATGTEGRDVWAQIADALVSIPKGLTPGVLKALDRLLGAGVDIPVAWLAQKKAKIEAQTESYKLVEGAVGQLAANTAASDADVAQRAVSVLLKSEYRKQINREAVASAMIEDLSKQIASGDAEAEISLNAEVDDDWLNVFQRYAEDASSEHLQGLWGRVLSGEIRKPGRFSARTLRFLSEFSQKDAISFEVIAKHSFLDTAPRNLVRPEELKDIRHLIYLESNGLIKGASGTGIQRTLKFNSDGYVILVEGNLAITFKGNPETSIIQRIVALTPIGQELLSLVPSRNQREAAKAVALASRVPEIHECHLGVLIRDDSGDHIKFIETLWVENSEEELASKNAAD